jgi:hypothetical protein
VLHSEEKKAPLKLRRKLQQCAYQTIGAALVPASADFLYVIQALSPLQQNQERGRISSLRKKLL